MIEFNQSKLIVLCTPELIPSENYVPSALRATSGELQGRV